MSIQGMVDAASPGSTVLVPTGTYNESVDITKPLTLKAVGSVTLTANTDANHGVITATNQNNVVVDGFKVIGGYWGILINGGSYNTVRNCFVKDPVNGGLVFGYAASDHALIENNIVDRTSDQYNEGMSIVDTHDSIIRNNYIIRNTMGEGIVVKGDGWRKNANYNNKIYSNTAERTHAGIYVGGDTLHDQEIYYNVAQYNDTQVGGILAQVEGGGKIWNYNIHDNYAGNNGYVGLGISLFGGDPGTQGPVAFENIQFRNNIAFGNGQNYLNLNLASVNSNNIVSPNYPSSWGYHAGAVPTCPQATLNMVI